jgi:uncharacterized protein involved in exopolysaccharide biosynthesis
MTIANLWAETLVERAAALYGPDTAQVTRYQAQRDLAKAALDEAEAELVAFQTENEAAILRAELQNREYGLTDLLNRQHRYTQIVDGAQNLLDRLEGQDRAAAANAADEAALLILVAQASSSSVAVASSAGSTSQSIAASPLQIQIGVNGAASGRTVEQLAAAVAAFADDVEARAAEAQTAAEELRLPILELQGRLARMEAQEQALRRERDLAQSQYLSLASKVEEVNIAAEDSASNVRIASQAAVPESPSGPGRVVTTLVAAALGLVFGALAALVWEWWRAPRAATRTTPAGVESAPAA